VGLDVRAEVLVPEMNLGQLSLLLRGKYLVDAIGYNHVRGLPLKAAELAEAIGNLVAEAEGVTVDLTTTTTDQEVTS
jgi:2-oxoglutarate ferredoxin oxidoreductase subunit alpha